MPITATKNAISLGRFLKERREDLKGSPKQISQNDVADALGMAQAYISKLEGGYLDNTIQERWQSSQRRTLLEAYRFTDSEVIEIAQRFSLELPARQPLTKVELLPDKPKRLIPMYDACAGYGIESEPMGYVEIDTDDVGDLALKVNGHSMVPTIESGDIVIVHKDVYSFGDVVAAKTEDGLVIKKLITDDVTKLPQLVSNDPDYTVLFEGEVHIIGKVVELRRRF